MGYIIKKIKYLFDKFKAKRGCQNCKYSMKNSEGINTICGYCNNEFSNYKYLEFKDE